MNFLALQTRLNNKLSDTGNVRWTAAFKQQNLNEAYRMLYRTMVEKGPVNIKTASISVVAGTQEYNLPSDFGRVYGRPHRDTDYLELDPTDYKNHDFDTDNGAALSIPCLFYIRDYYKVETTASYAKIGLRPIPDTSFTLSVDYIPQMVDMAVDADVPLVPELFHELIVLGAGLVCLEDVTNDDSRYRNYLNRYKDMYKQFEQYMVDQIRGIQPQFLDTMEPDVNYFDH